MSQPPKYNRRIVSKSQYVQAQGKRIGVTSVGCGLLLLTAPCAVVTLLVLRWAFADKWTRLKPEEWWWGVFVLLSSGTLTFFLGKWGKASLNHADQIDPGIPLTRLIADTLPAQERLVRASEEPIQEQQAILLRAAMNNHETPAEQLVRAVGERES